MNTEPVSTGRNEGTDARAERGTAKQDEPGPSAQPALVLCELTPTRFAGLESYSPFCVKVHRALRAKGLRYERRHAHTPASHRAHNAVGQVPVLLVDGVAFADSTKILARVEALGSRRLLPDEPRERAEALLWEELADTALNGFFVAARWADARNWPGVRDAYFGALPAPIRAVIPRVLRANVVKGLKSRDVWRAGAAPCWERYGLLLDALEARAPESAYWLGAALTVADLALFAQLHGLRNALTAPQQAMIASRARLSRWLDRVDAATRAGT